MTEPPPRSAQGSAARSARFEQLLIASRLVAAGQLHECREALAQAGRAGDGALAAELLRRGWITRWQLAQLQRGQTAFFLDQDRYLLLDLIGRGGMGAVYKARHVRMGRDVALKVIDPKRVTDQSLTQRFRREVEVCSKLQNEHIVQAFDCGIHAGAIFLVLEFVEGADLASVVKRDGPMRPEEATAVCLQVAAGLAYAHSQGVVHRDIKPQNILLSSAGVVKILDMGLARLLDDPAGDPHTSLTQEGTVMGTVDYMPPEQARDTHSADPRSDIYSLGGTLYYLLAGRPPFAGGSVIEKMQRLALESPAPLSEIRIDCPPALDEIVQKMLAKRPEERFQTAGDVVRALRPFAAERIAGRAVVTAAVQSAADTQQVVAGVDTTFETAFVPEYESILATRKRQSARPRAGLYWKVTAGIMAAAALIIGLAAWSLPGKGRPIAQRPPPRSAAGAAEKPLGPPAPATIARELPGPFGTPTSLAWSPNGRRLAVGTLDGDVWVRSPDRPTWRPIRYSEHASSVVALTWIPESELVASAEDAGEIHLWNSVTGKTQRRIKRRRSGGYQNSVWSARLVSVPNGSELAYADGPGTMKRLRLPDVESLGSIVLPGHGVLADACYSRSGDMIAISCSYQDNTFQVLVADLRAKPEERSFSIGVPTTAVPLMVAFIGDEELAIASQQRVEVWNVLTRELARQFEIPHSKPMLVGWTRHGGVTAAAPRFAYWSDENEMQLLSPVDGTANRVPIGMPGIIDYSTLSPLDFAPDLSRLAYWPTVPAVARVVDGETRRPWGAEQFGIINENPHVHGNVLLQISNQQTWDLRTGALRPDLAGKLYVARPGGLIQVLDGDTIRFYADAAGGSQEAAPPVVLEGRSATEDLYGCRWSRDGRRLFQFRDDRVLHVWDADTGRKVAALQSPDSVNAYDATCDGKTILMSADRQNFLSTEPHDAPLREFTASNERQSRRSIAGDGRFAVWIEPGTGYRIADGRGFALGASELSIYPGSGIDVAGSGEHVLMFHGIWRLAGAVPEKLWQCPEKPRAVHLMHNSRTYVGNAWFDDETHVAIVMDAAVHIWNWRENRKRASIYLMPESNWAFVNHETKCWTGSPGADRYLSYEYFDAVRNQTVGLDPAGYAAETGWKNDRKKAGLAMK